MTSSLETKWDYSGRKRRDGKNKKVDKVNKRREKGEKQNMGKGMDKGEGVPRAHLGPFHQVIDFRLYNTPLYCFTQSVYTELLLCSAISSHCIISCHKLIIHKCNNTPQLLQQTLRSVLVTLLMKPDVKFTAGLVTARSVSTVED